MVKDNLKLVDALQVAQRRRGRRTLRLRRAGKADAQQKNEEEARPSPPDHGLDRNRVGRHCRGCSKCDRDGDQSVKSQSF